MESVAHANAAAPPPAGASAFCGATRGSRGARLFPRARARSLSRSRRARLRSTGGRSMRNFQSFSGARGAREAGSGRGGVGRGAIASAAPIDRPIDRCRGGNRPAPHPAPPAPRLTRPARAAKTLKISHRSTPRRSQPRAPRSRKAPRACPRKKPRAARSARGPAKRRRTGRRWCSRVCVCNRLQSLNEVFLIFPFFSFYFPYKDFAARIPRGK